MAVQFNAVEIAEKPDSKVMQIRLAGKLSVEDYELFVPKIERSILEHGKIRIILELIDFHGWTAGALWEDVKFDARHFNDIERLAIIGDSKWEKGMAIFCKPFTSASIRYFDVNEIDEAKQWIRE
jgi:hypothetical protein